MTRRGGRFPRMLKFTIGVILLTSLTVTYLFNTRTPRNADSLAANVASMPAADRKGPITFHPKFRLSRNADVPELTKTCSQQERVSHMRQVCDRLGNTTRRRWHTDSGLEPPANAIIDTRLRLVACLMENAGSRAFKQLLLKAHGVELNTTVYKKNVDSIGLLNPLGVWYYYQGTPHRKSNLVVEPHFRFMQVRHPFQRLLQYYTENLLYATDVYSKTVFRQIVRHVRHPAFLNNSTQNNEAISSGTVEVPTFVEFLQWVSDSKIEYDYWRTVMGFCNPCGYVWDAILRTETLEVDIQSVLQRRLKVKNLDIDSAIASEFRVFDNMKVDIPNFTSVPPAVIAKLLTLYEHDMDIFGYGWDWKSHTATCSIRAKDGHSTCC